MLKSYVDVGCTTHQIWECNIPLYITAPNNLSPPYHGIFSQYVRSVPELVVVINGEYTCCYWIDVVTKVFIVTILTI